MGKCALPLPKITMITRTGTVLFLDSGMSMSVTMPSVEVVNRGGSRIRWCGDGGGGLKYPDDENNPPLYLLEDMTASKRMIRRNVKNKICVCVYMSPQ